MLSSLLTGTLVRQNIIPAIQPGSYRGAGGDWGCGKLWKGLAASLHRSSALTQTKGKNLNPGPPPRTASLQVCFWKALKLFAMAQPSTSREGFPPAPTSIYGSIISVLISIPEDKSRMPLGQGMLHHCQQGFAGLVVLL